MPEERVSFPTCAYRDMGDAYCDCGRCVPSKRWNEIVERSDNTIQLLRDILTELRYLKVR